MEFLQQLSEARIIGNSRTGLKRYDARDIAELLFLYFNAIQILKYEFHGMPHLKKYLANAGSLANVNAFITSKNDLYILMHVLFGNQNKPQLAMLKHKEANEIFIPTLRIDMSMVRKYILLAKNGKSDPSFERRFLLSLESGLRIRNANYRSIRRLTMDWGKETDSVKRLVMTRMLQIFRAKARRAEILPILEKVSKLERMEDKKLKPLEDEGLGQKKSKTGSILKTLALGAAGAAVGYALTRKK